MFTFLKPFTRSLQLLAFTGAIGVIVISTVAASAANACGGQSQSPCATAPAASPGPPAPTGTPTLVMASAAKPVRTPTPTPSPTPTVTLGWLDTQGAQIVNEQGQNVILRGVNVSGMEYDISGSEFSQSEMQYIAQNWHARVIRVPLNEDWVLNDPAYLTRLDTIVGWINGAGMYADLDLQWVNTTVEIAPIPDDNASTMWNILAKRYKDNPAVLYDVYSQPHDIPWSTWEPIAAQLVNAIHDGNPRALVFVSGVHWGYDLSGIASQPVPGPNVVYSAHEYSWNEPIPRTQAWGYLVGAVPLFVGEWGGTNQDVSPWGTTLRDYLRAQGIGYAAWSWNVWPYLTKDASAGDYRPTKFGTLIRDDLLSGS